MTTQPTSIPLWLQSAVVAVKWACSVQFVMGDVVKVMENQVRAWAQRELRDDEDLPDDIHEQLKNAALYNDGLEARGLQRQTIRTFVILGKWREAPIPRKRTAAVATREEVDVLTAEERQRRDAAWHNHLLEVHQREAPNLPFAEWKRQHDLRIELWARFCQEHPQVPRLPIPPLVGEELDLGSLATKEPSDPTQVGQLFQSIASPSPSLAELVASL